MELVYLWVEKYKNIEHQGFNFSPRFECTFHDEYNDDGTLKDDCVLDIKPKEHIENFFGKNINITAIVGENGSGKSSLLEYLAEIFRIEHNKNRNLIVDKEHRHNFSLAFKIKDKTYKIQSIDHHDTSTFKDDEKIENILDYYIYSNDKKIENQFLFDNASIAQMIVYDYSKNKNFQLSSFMYLPTKIEIRLCNFERKFEKLITNDKLYPLSKDERDDIYIKDTGNEQQTQIAEFENINNDKYLQFLILKLLENNEETHNFYLTKEEIQTKLTSQKVEFVSEDDFNKYFTISEELFQKFEKEVTVLDEKEREIYIEKYYDFFEFDFIDEKYRRYSNLSHGEKTLFGQLLNIYYNSEKSKNDNLLFLFDEPETALHPQWQKNYINEIYNLVNKLNKNYHFILTSHSPFILSDLPKENVIFLENGEQKYPFKDNEQTFGANIHTLLSHGFFMNDGLMGEFAKEKIDKALTLLNKSGRLSRTSLAYCENIISIIGEPIIKKQLQKMLDSKRLSKIDEIDRLKADMAEIHKKIKRLEERK
jgi:predicted ATP-dependent endonuclease of OLD family